MITFTDSLSFYKFYIGSSSGTIPGGPKTDRETSQSTQNLGVVLYLERCICKFND